MGLSHRLSHRIERVFAGCALLPLFFFSVAGVGRSSSCTIYGNNVQGQLVFSQRFSASQGGGLVVEVLGPDLRTVIRREDVPNPQGFIAVPYSTCVDPRMDFALRAFVDRNGDGEWQAGEPSGRDDGLATGHTDYALRRIEPERGRMPVSESSRLKSIDIAIDEADAQ